MTLDTAAMLGRRVECDGFKGTVLFAGEIAGTGTGAWLGVDWDDVSRGKHDGSHKEIRYFSTRTPTSGSFVRPHKINFGRTCSEAIMEQYEPLEEEKLDTMQREAVFKANRAQVKTFEYVGFEKILEKTSKHENLTSIDLNDKCIREGDSSLSQICPNVVELDLRQNLFSSWHDIASVTKHLPCLNILNVSQNRISFHVDDSLVPAFQNVEHLIAGRMEWTCNDLVDAAKLFPNLKSLQVPDNKLTSLNTQLCSLLPKLQTLDLDNNPIGNWNEVMKLSQLETLEVLYLKNTGLSDIKCDANSFPALKNINLSHNNINDWLSVGALDNLKNLEDLHFRENPVLNCENFDTNRQIIICRIEGLKMLDKIVITSVERRGAALDYLKKYGKLYLKSLTNVEDLKTFNLQHPCYHRLVEKYGAPEEAELFIKSMKLKNSLISLSIVCPNSGSSVIKKKFPPSMKVQRLRGMIQKLFCTGGNSLHLSYRCQDKADTTYEFDNDLKDLSFYSIQDGDEIIVTW